jgi:V8-like Glu-specific endopeptidase
MSSWYYSGNPGTDFSVMRMNKNSAISIGTKTGYLGYAWNQPRVLAWWAIGYPAASPFSGAYMTACQTSYAYDETFGTPNLFAYGCDMTGGCSGGPVIKFFGSTGNYLNGVNAYRHTSQPKELISPYVDSTIATSLFALARTW